jgi:hypothetical protein
VFPVSPRREASILKEYNIFSRHPHPFLAARTNPLILSAIALSFMILGKWDETGVPSGEEVFHEDKNSCDVLPDPVAVHFIMPVAEPAPHLADPVSGQRVDP